MPIKYSIHKTKINGKPVYNGRVQTGGTYSRDMLVSRMSGMGTSLGREDIDSVLSLFEKAVHNICLEGGRISIEGFMQFAPAVGGSFEGESDAFDKSRNEIYVTAQISRAFNNSFAGCAGVEKAIASERKPHILDVADNETGVSNNYITKNNIVMIRGKNLKFYAGRADEYLRFVKAKDRAQYIDIKKCQKITDRQIVFLMPDPGFKAGYFEICSSMGTTTIRTGTSPVIEVR
jgi:hypothetical protein